MHRIAVIPGDGIGKEVVPEGIRVLNAAGKRFGIQFKWEFFSWGCEYFLSHGEMMPPDGLEILKGFDAIYLGAVGAPELPDHVSLWGLLLPIRRAFHQYINLRPVRLLKGMQSPLKDKKPEDIDLCVVRENNEGEYSNIGGKMYEGTDQEMVVQASVFTRKGVEKVIRFAFDLAMTRPKRHLTSATKSNGIVYTMPYWDEIFRQISKEYPEINADQYHIDGLVAALVLHPEKFDVLVGSNLFGDILSDLTPALAGSLGIAPSANLNPEHNFPSMFEPVHGSAPDIAGKGIANPTGQIWSGAMMLDYLGYGNAAKAIEEAIAAVLADGKTKTPDMGGGATTQEVGEAIAEYVLAGKI
jgi:tartrate dehydrogenase/decarboxylase/D-malate dehydrogenase